MPAMIKSAAVLREAVHHYLECGNGAEVGRRMNLSRHTINCWMRLEEWQQIKAELEAELDAEFKARYRKVIRRGLDQALERLEVGDARRVGDDGQLYYAPVSARDAALVSALAMDKLRLLEGKPGRLIATASIKDIRTRFESEGQTVIHRQGEGQTIDSVEITDDNNS